MLSADLYENSHDRYTAGFSEGVFNAGVQGAIPVDQMELERKGFVIDGMLRTFSFVATPMEPEFR